MAIVSDDERAVNAAHVTCAWKVTADDSQIWWIVLTCDASSNQVTYRFGDAPARDDFYKKLVDAMGQ